MKATVKLAGQSVTDAWLAAVPEEPDDEERAPDSARLAGAPSERAFLDELMRLIQSRSAVETPPRLDFPVRPGWIGSSIRGLRDLLWKLLRYQHHRITLQHNAVHALHASALEFEHREGLRREAELLKRITALEERVGPRGAPRQSDATS